VNGCQLDGQRLVSCSADNTIKVWDLKTGKRLYSLLGGSLQERAGNPPHPARYRLFPRARPFLAQTRALTHNTHDTRHAQTGVQRPQVRRGSHCGRVQCASPGLLLHRRRRQVKTPVGNSPQRKSTWA
jgi:hypothetical protein